MLFSNLAINFNFIFLHPMPMQKEQFNSKVRLSIVNMVSETNTKVYNQLSQFIVFRKILNYFLREIFI